MDLLELFPLRACSRDGVHLCADDFLEHPIIFVERFWKWRDSLFLVAHRVLGDWKAATEAVEACFHRTCSEPPKFASEGEFGSWLLRILIDESLQERRRRAANYHCYQTLKEGTRPGGNLRRLDDFWCLDTSV